MRGNSQLCIRNQVHCQLCSSGRNGQRGVARVCISGVRVLASHSKTSTPASTPASTPTSSSAPSPTRAARGGSLPFWVLDSRVKCVSRGKYF